MGEVASLLSGHRLVGIDTSLFVYQFESDHYPQFAPVSQELFELVQSGAIQGVTSTITLAEVAVIPHRLGRADLAYQYGYILRNMPNLRLVDIDYRVADQAAFFRTKYGLKTPDALQISAALSLGATAFVTGDQELRKVTGEIAIAVLTPTP